MSDLPPTKAHACNLIGGRYDKDALLAYFKVQSLACTTTDHPPVFTVDESAEIKSSLPGGHSKNLFLKDKAGRLALISAKDDTQIRLNRLHKVLGFDRFSFGPEDAMLRCLGVVPGSVTAFGLINDAGHEVRFFLDKALWDCDPLNFHPLINTATTSMSRSEFRRFLDGLGRPLVLLDFSSEGDEPQIIAP